LRDDLKISVEESANLATSIAKDIKGLSDETKLKLRESSIIPIKDRIDEIVAFQSWMDLVRTLPKHPAIIRAQVITQNYVCFVYLGESLFRSLKNVMLANSTTKKCCKFLLDNPVRAFRNAIAHANWRYKDDFSGIEFWARKGEDINEPMTYFEVTQQELDFWQSLARCTAYSALSSL
jgi:hypothetical protein